MHNVEPDGLAKFLDLPTHKEIVSRSSQIHQPWPMLVSEAVAVSQDWPIYSKMLTTGRDDSSNVEHGIAGSSRKASIPTRHENRH